MNNAPLELEVSTTRETAEALRKAIDAHAGNDARLIERKNLDGEAAVWIVVATLASQAVPHVLTFIKDLLTLNQANRIVIDGVTIPNSPADLERARSLIDAKIAKARG